MAGSYGSEICLGGRFFHSAWCRSSFWCSFAVVAFSSLLVDSQTSEQCLCFGQVPRKLTCRNKQARCCWGSDVHMDFSGRLLCVSLLYNVPRCLYKEEIYEVWLIFPSPHCSTVEELRQRWEKLVHVIRNSDKVGWINLFSLWALILCCIGFLDMANLFGIPFCSRQHSWLAVWSPGAKLHTSFQLL